jgi:hypothetical protein
MRNGLLVAAAVFAVAGGASPAGADTISIGWSKTAGGAPKTLATASAPGSASSTTALDSFLSNAITGTDFFPLDLGASTSDAASAGTAPIYLYVSETGITYDASELMYTIGLNESTLPSGWKVTETVYTDAGDATYGKETKLASHSFSAGGFKSISVTEPVAWGAPFSLTEEIVIKPGTKAGMDLSGISVVGAVVPETSTWAMIMLGFAGLGYAAFRRGAKRRPVEAF